MVRSKYYRRQSDLCRELALVQRDQKAALWLIEFAEELMAKADDAAAFNASASDRVPASAEPETARPSL